MDFIIIATAILNLAGVSIRAGTPLREVSQANFYRPTAPYINTRPPLDYFTGRGVWPPFLPLHLTQITHNNKCVNNINVFKHRRRGKRAGVRTKQKQNSTSYAIPSRPSPSRHDLLGNQNNENHTKHGTHKLPSQMTQRNNSPHIFEPQRTIETVTSLRPPSLHLNRGVDQNNLIQVPVKTDKNNPSNLINVNTKSKHNGNIAQRQSTKITAPNPLRLLYTNIHSVLPVATTTASTLPPSVATSSITTPKPVPLVASTSIKTIETKIETIIGHRPTPHPTAPRPPSTLSSVRLSSTQAKLNLNVYLLNCQSCREKTIEIHDLILEKDMDILFLTETWLRPEGDEPIIAASTPPCYTFKSFPRQHRRGGGIAVIYRTTLSNKITTKLISRYETHQALHTRLSLCSNELNFVCVYRPPIGKLNKVSISKVRDDFNDLLSTVGSQPGHPIVLGDFNFHFDDASAICKIQDILDQNDMTQIISKPTHRGGHILDGVIINNSFAAYCETDVTYLPFSDHELVEIFLNIPKPKHTKRNIYTRNIKDINIVDFKNDLKTELSHCHGITADQWNHTIANVFDKHAPIKCRAITERVYAPWYSSEVRKAKNECRKAERDYRHSQSTSHKDLYMHQFRKWKKIVKKTKASYFLTKFENTNSCKQLFGICDELLGRKKCTTLPNNINREELPNSFSNFFSDKVKTIRSRLDNFEHFMEPDTFAGCSLDTFKPVTEDFIHRLITRAPVKSCELDPLPANLLSSCIDVLLPSITTLINASLISGVVPSCFKNALVHPLLKKPSLDQNDLKNYRPVSNLPFISKLLEKVILSQLQTHLFSNCLEEPFQSAYREHHCTETALIKVFNDLTLNAMSNEINMLCLLDLSAAFDTIDHNILLTRLENTFGIRGKALKWFESYLTGRWQSIVAGGVKSQLYPLTFGVPQGSVLGPVLFTVYMQPLSSIIKKFDLNFHFYADDSQIYGSSNVESIQKLLVRIENCFLEIKKWMNENRLMLNDEKTEMLMCGRKNVCKSVKCSSVTLGGNRIPFSNCVRNLGVYIDSDLSMSHQVNHLIRCMYIEIRKISKIRKLIPFKVAELLVNSLVLSKLDYCNSLLSNVSVENIRRLQTVQNNAARLIFKKKRMDSATPLLYDLHWLSVEKRIIYKLCTIVYKALSTDSPSYIRTMLTIYVPPRNLRSSLDKSILVVPKTTRKIGEQSFHFSAPKFWNSLPGHVRCSETLAIFKKRLKYHLFTN